MCLFQQDSVTAHTADSSVVSRMFLATQQETQSSLFTKSEPIEFLLVAHVHGKNPCNDDDLEESIQGVVSSFSPAELQCAMSTFMT
jgi:hypothetical protein